MNEWNLSGNSSAAAYATRVGYVTGKSGGLNGSYYLEFLIVRAKNAGSLR